MARRKKSHKEELREIEAPVLVEEKLWSLSDWMEKHWKPVLAGLTIVSLVWGAIGIYQIVSASSEQERALTTAGVFQQLWTPVVPPPASPDEPPAATEGPSFPDEQARAKAAIGAAKEQDPRASLMVDLVLGAARALTGDYAGQLKAVDAALAKVGGEALELPLREQRATALAGLGKTADAAAEWGKLGAQAPTAFGKALAHARTGDLYNPTLGAKDGDPAKAKAAYQKALETARPGGKDPAPGALAFLAADVQSKLARL